jgi:hemoglobin
MRGWGGLLVALAVAGSGCARQKPAGRERPGGPDPHVSLYSRLGEEPAIRAVAVDAVERALRDPRVRFAREGTPREWSATPEEVRRVEGQLTAFLVEITGGPRKYDGPGMREAHRGMGITEAEFLAFKEDLKAAIEIRHIPAPAGRELLRLVEDFRGEIVEAGPLGRPLTGDGEADRQPR